MIIRPYFEDDLPRISRLVYICQGRKLPERLGGTGVVIEEDEKIVAFAWALSTPASDMACVEFFAVDPDKRAQKIYGPTVITALLKLLYEGGVKEVIGLLVAGEQYTDSLTSIYHEVGMTANTGYVVHGYIKEVLDGIESRYGDKHGKHRNTKNNDSRPHA